MAKGIPSYLFFLLFCLISFQSKSQVQSPVYHPTYRVYNSLDGKTQTLSQHIFQDSKGYIWEGAREGVNKFDGLVFENHNTKPVDLEEIQATLRDFRKDFDPGNEKEKLIIRRKAAITSLYLDEILYVRVNGNHASIHSIYKQSIPTNETISEIAEKLPASDFYRADASTLIRRKAVLRGMIDPTDNRFIIQLRGIKGIVEVVVARSKFTDFKRENWS